VKRIGWANLKFVFKFSDIFIITHIKKLLKKLGGGPWPTLAQVVLRHCMKLWGNFTLYPNTYTFTPTNFQKFQFYPLYYLTFYKLIYHSHFQHSHSVWVHPTILFRYVFQIHSSYNMFSKFYRSTTHPFRWTFFFFFRKRKSINSINVTIIILTLLLKVNSSNIRYVIRNEPSSFLVSENNNITKSEK
jgi:hypothetical protein